METVFIYGLNDPITGQCRYVGRAVNTQARFYRHLWWAKKGSSRQHVYNWIRSLTAAGLQPVLEVLDEVPQSQWEFWEREYIRLFRAIFPGLTNASPGGDFIYSWAGKKQSKETVEKRVSKLRGKPLSPEHRAKVSAAKKGIPPSPKTLAAAAAARVKKQLTKSKGCATVNL